jgi:hypothetical protein
MKFPVQSTTEEFKRLTNQDIFDFLSGPLPDQYSEKSLFEFLDVRKRKRRA